MSERRLSYGSIEFTHVVSGDTSMERVRGAVGDDINTLIAVRTTGGEGKDWADLGRR